LISISKAIPAHLTRKQLEQLTTTLSIDQSFGVLTKNAFQVLIFPKIRDAIRAIIFFDINNLHSLNHKYGYKEIDRRLKSALTTRRADVVMRWFSGDEIVWVLLGGDPSGAVQRIASQLEQQGLGATFSFASVQSSISWNDFDQIVTRLSNEVVAKKSVRQP
jgi:GGDEF domain-containing protein